MLLVVALMLLSGCAITHEYGPYMGKVVDKESGEPIAGAVVFVQFFTEFGFSPGGAVSDYADAEETLTNENGEYYLPPFRITTFRIGDSWGKRGHAIIFKPGYGAYPGHALATDGNQPEGWLREGMPDTIMLPKLATKKERLDYLYHANRWSSDVPCEKLLIILRMYNLERVSLGLEPVMTNVCGDIRHEK